MKIEAKIKLILLLSKESTTMKQAVKTAAAMHGETAVAEPVKVLKRVGSTQFVVNVRFSENETETLEDKLLRIIESEVRNSA
jgi:hypothetical protein